MIKPPPPFPKGQRLHWVPGEANQLGLTNSAGPGPFPQKFEIQPNKKTSQK